MSSEKLASESSVCLWISGPTFLGDPEVMLEKNSYVRLRSERTGGLQWMFLKETQFSFAIWGLAEAAAMALSSSQAWICPIAATQSRGIWGAREAGQGVDADSAGTLFLCCRQELMLLEIRYDVNIYTMGIGRQYKPGLPTPNLTVQHFPARRCMWILDFDCPLSILLQRGHGRGHRAMGQEEEPGHAAEERGVHFHKGWSLGGAMSWTRGKNDVTCKSMADSCQCMTKTTTIL